MKTKQFTFDFVKKRSQVCPCGADKPANRIICGDCWKTAPFEARNTFSQGDPSLRHRAIRELLEHASLRQSATPADASRNLRISKL